MVTNLGQNVYGQPTNEQGLSLFIYHVRLIVANCLQLRGVVSDEIGTEAK